MPNVKVQIEEKLQAAFSPEALTVSDDSHSHAGHAGAPDGGQSHFTVDIVSDRFAGKTRIDCHRMINEVLADELAGPIHALAIRAKAPV